MRTITGSLWTEDSEVKVIPTNGMYTEINPFLFKAHMGAGVARSAADRWPRLPYLLGGRLKLNGNRLYVFQVPHAYRQSLLCVTLVTYPTKHIWRDPSTVDLVRSSVIALADAADQNGWETILLPRVGCGLGGLDWLDVEPILNDYLDDRFTVVDWRE